MIPIRAIVVSVNYDDLLKISLPLNMRHFSECLVVTSHEDEGTQRVASSVPHVRTFKTDAFRRHGASFNKGYALELAFQQLDRKGWLCVWDADTILPSDLKGVDGGLSPVCLYSARRRILSDPREYTHSYDWSRAPITTDLVYPGYFHLFHTSDPALRNPPWYDVTFSHAGGGDGYFQSRWPSKHKIRLPFEVLHLGPRDTNWFGRVSPRLDELPVGTTSEQMNQLHELWRHRHTLPPHERYGGRVSVPGHAPRPWIHF